MKSIFAFVVIILLFYTSFAQELNSSKSLKSALEQSAQSNKPVLIIINPPNGLKLDNPTRAIANFKSAIEDEEVIKKINNFSIVYQTTLLDTSIRSVIRQANIKVFPAYVFLRSDKEVFFSEFANSNDKAKYLLMIDKAMLAYKEKSISALEKEYEADKTNNVLLKKLIDARKKVGITNNADLIEQYASNLKIGDFNNYQNVLYILEAGPYADGTAYKLAYTNRKITDSLYRTEPLQKRVTINNAIISNTMLAAAKNKNTSKAYAGANFARSTWSGDYRAGDKAYNNQMLWYYSTIKDTATYLKTAGYFYDNHYMNISADSIKKMENRNHQANIKKSFPQTAEKKVVSKERIDSLMKLPGVKKITQEIVTVTSSSSVNYANELNNAAWKFYETGTKNINYLSKAMIWSRRSIELNPIPGYYDTLAHILYRMGYYEEAVKTQETAIQKAREEKNSTTNFEAELKKIKAKSL